MKKWLKILLSIIGILIIIAFVFFKIYLSPKYVDEPSLSSELRNEVITVDNLERSFLWYAPKSYDNINTIIFVLHGSTSDGQSIRQGMAYEFDKIADREGLVVVYPTGYENHWNDCRGTADYTANTNDVNDFNFLLAIGNHIETKLNTTFQYRFATGHSNGGHMCYKLALEHPISANLPIDDNLDCDKSEQFVPICLINGTADPINPYEGGLVEIMGNTSRGSVLSTHATMEYWTGLGNCSTPQVIKLENKVTSDNSSVVQTSWRCDSTIQAIEYKIVDGGHTIPHPESRAPKLFGVTNQDINAPEVIWQFFKQLKAN